MMFILRMLDVTLPILEWCNPVLMQKL